MIKIVSPEFYENILNRFPGLIHRMDYRRLFCYLAFSVPNPKIVGFETGDYERLLLGYQFIATLAGEHQAGKNNNFKVQPFLDGFKKNIIPNFRYAEYIPNQAVRYVIDNGFDKETIALITKEVHKKRSERTVFFHSGKKDNLKNKVIEATFNTQIDESIATHKELIEDQRLIIDCLPKTFRAFVLKLKANHAAIINQISLLPEETKIQQLKIIGSIEQHINIQYGPGKNSYRLFPFGTTPLSLKRNVRKALCHGWTDVDLQASQLAIFSAWRNCPLTYSIFQKSLNPWQEILNSLDRPFNDDNKAALKKLTYPLIFGSSEENALDNLKVLGINRFDKNPFFAEIYQQRAILFDQIKAAGEIVDHYGKAHKLKMVFEKETGYNRKKSIWAGSLTAIYIQAVELSIMASIANFLKTTMGVEAMLFQHDGMTVSFSIPDRKEKILQKMHVGISKAAADLGLQLFGKEIFIKLDYEDL